MGHHLAHVSINILKTQLKFAKDVIFYANNAPVIKNFVSPVLTHKISYTIILHKNVLAEMVFL